MSRFVVTGTDTDVGKTVFAAALAAHLGAHYWKPIQAGTGDGTDSARVAELSGWRAAVLPEAYVLKTPCSPHEAARIDGVMIAPDRLALPAEDGPLVVEGAGGVLVPITGDLLYADLFARWGLPVILVARTMLGTINHSLLSLEALRCRGVTVHSIAFVGEAEPASEEAVIRLGAGGGGRGSPPHSRAGGGPPPPASEEAVIRLGKVTHLGRLPRLDPLTPDTLAKAFAAHIRTDHL
ncbi:dethiobiotin synthase [Novosphingobium sp.]|uniref:dethiobiotin synthase n=1 Tax=Novosphingobium sp. TaxID=1874826 RepID=UPI0035AE20A4